MALDSIKLDDLTWSEMAAAIRRRIPAASDGRWTLHAPVDPGITLLELFAWLLEQRVYRMDQIPDSLMRGTLALLGEAPKTTQAAGGVMRFPAPDTAETLTAMTELSLYRSNPPLVFSTQDEVVLLPFVLLPSLRPDATKEEQDRAREQGDRLRRREKLGLFIGGKDRMPDLDQGKVVRLFPADGSASETNIVIWLTTRLPATMADKHISLMIDLRDESDIPPQWSPDAVANVPPPAKITWLYSNGVEPKAFEEAEVEDGTGGLRRSGLVRLPIKSDWLPETPDAEGHYAYALWMRVDQTTFTAPPRLERLVPNVVIASHKSKTRERPLGRDWLPLPGNVIALADLPENEDVKDLPPIEDTIELQLKERDGVFHPWKMTSDLSFHGPADRVFTVDRDCGELGFGDGLTGRLPVLAKDAGSQVKVKYCVGGGRAGRLGANLTWEGAVWQAINVVRTEGGEEPEAILAARERVAATLKQRTRAVTADDYEEIARTTPGIAIKRAYAAIGFHPAHPCARTPGAATVFIVPAAPRPDVLGEEWEQLDGTRIESAFVAAPMPDPGALALVRGHLNETRLVATEVFVAAPVYRPVALAIEIESDAGPGGDRRALIGQKIKRRLRTFLDPLIGGDSGEGWPFGEPLRPSAILREAQRELGDQGNIARVRISLLDVLPLTEVDCDDLPIGAHSLVEPREVRVIFHQASGGHGGLQ